LLDNDGEIPALNLEALMECSRSQVGVALATGRRWSTTKRLLDRLNLWPWIDFAIINNGMVIQDLRQMKTLSQSVFPHPLALDITESLAGLGMDPILLSHLGEGQETDVWYRNVSLLNQDFIEKNRHQSQTWTDFEQLKSLDLVEILLIGFQEDLQVAQNKLQGFPVETALIRNTFYREWMLEITPKGVNKFSGATYLQTALGLSPDHTMAIGDSDNDLSLLQAAAHRVAMEDAPISLKNLAHRIAPSNHVGGMGLSVMEWLNA
jgi:Cof subfamily protein (haloacid dehalogenase superfamily)